MEKGKFGNCLFLSWYYVAHASDEDFVETDSCAEEEISLDDIVEMTNTNGE